MSEVQTAPYGSWLSPITPELVASSGLGLEALMVSGQNVYWLESRPQEGGRYVIVCLGADGTTRDIIPADFNARTLVHEYGGGAFFVQGEVVWFSNYADQRLYRVDPGQLPYAITPEPEVPSGLRYADGRVTPDGSLIICVREQHRPDGEVINELVALPADGSSEPYVIATGDDFYASPRISPDGSRLVWLAWNHPQMPWDGTELWMADLGSDGKLENARLVAGGVEESIMQPAWSPEGRLYFISDRSGWWNLYHIQEGEPVSLSQINVEFASPPWQFGASNYVFWPDGRILCVYSYGGSDHLGWFTPGQVGMIMLDVRFTSIHPPVLQLSDEGRLWLIGGSPSEAPVVASLDIDSGEIEVVRRSENIEIEPGYISLPRSITFPTTDDREAYALFYPPQNQDYQGPSSDAPPLIVISHGGPTSAARTHLRLPIQYWTSRGFGVVDVNYGGSSGYGRAYRERLRGQWGVVDVEDCVNAAQHLAERGEVDIDRMAIRGGSAGGYTTLCALTFKDIFAAGASYYGVADVEALAGDTHKFEARYLDGLIGPYPEAKDLYVARSPIHFTEQISSPMILFQGLEDKVVPPSQSEMMVAALEAKGLPYAYLTFEGEQHGFRKAETIQRCLGAELYFYSRVFGFELAETVEPVEIHGL